ncbi:MAG: aminotransferase class I/II-fold pyridoxal phosphate-dependent enzyme [Acidobacteriota bacterium]
MQAILDRLAAGLAGRASKELHRRLEPPSGIDFCSNDYLGLSTHPQLRPRLLKALESGPLAAPSSRLVRGHTAAHAALEKRLAAFKGTEAALLFGTGYQANTGLLSALLSPGDRVLSDALNHASLIDGMRLARAQKVIFPHLDVAAVKRELQRPWPGGATYLVTESLFSMEGDRAPLDQYAELAQRYGAGLVVDDAHAVGVHGEARGSGLTETFGVANRVLAIVSTFGKGLGLFGAFAAGPRVVMDTLVNHARSFIFSTAPPPLLLAAVSVCLDLLEEEPERRGKVLTLAERLRQRLAAADLVCLGNRSAIVPVLLRKNRRALEVARYVREQGFDVRAIRPKTVPAGTARIRMSVHADHTEDQIDALAQAFKDAVRGSRP